MAKAKEAPRQLIVKDCKSCPIRIRKESHGGCSSTYWTECNLTHLVIDNQDDWQASKWQYAEGGNKDFPPTCPLEAHIPPAFATASAGG